MTNSVLGVRNIQHTNGTDAMSIDTSGNVTVNQPLRNSVIPAWRVGLNINQDVTSSGTWVKIVWDKLDVPTEHLFNQDITYSNGTFTITHAGVYQINTSIRVDGLTTDSGYFITAFRKNGASTNSADTYHLKSRYTSSYVSFSLSDIFKCEVGDYLEVWGYSSNDASWHFQSEVSHCSGARIG